MITEKRKCVDLLVEEFWRKGYLTLKRRFGTYLPEPENIGGFPVDVVARQRKNYAIGITLNPEDLNDPSLPGRISYLATRQTRNSSGRVLLFLGIISEKIQSARELVRKLPPEVSKNIRIVPIMEEKLNLFPVRDKKTLFS